MAGKRRSKLEIGQIKEALYAALEAYHPMTVRQVFYQMVSRGVIGKTENEYDNTICRLLTKMRRAGELPYGWIADNTRWMRKPDTYSSMQSMLNYSARTYRRALWNEQPVYCEVWLEKDALAGVLMEETEKWDVPLMVTRGYASLSYLFEAAQAISAKRKPAFLYYFGDHDPSGVDIPRKVIKTLRELAPGSQIEFQRIAVTPQQILEWGLQTRPTKKTDSRSKAFEGESVEVDAIPPEKLMDLVRECIVDHLDVDLLERTLEIEKQEHETLDRIVSNWQSLN
jgi:hypothetical protein